MNFFIDDLRHTRTTHPIKTATDVVSIINSSRFSIIIAIVIGAVDSLDSDAFDVSKPLSFNNAVTRSSAEIFTEFDCIFCPIFSLLKN
ncbi:hypothetical protein HanRHA438_Chr04g0160231 [Helianthus annuus]|nr:hypothetical protein HanIR_Chr04g0161461 [Helianthus annuus]KAJ0925481.1 hypothetical protein HanRHA438_Chr04g0160231 [Helianthus annuus]